ncbi:hypothetical protein [Streptomyces sp. SID13726]|uniref:hypothetical protein n=1 Tax=Streptomyces sp. SID13726 TaxID=2706058 RepID=UPI0013B5B47C|nr:hypothetical protein [Streptomyces sp. SID13726]NEB03364.1 hypothetical protein [Streptomyces sp. SID13726]
MADWNTRDRVAFEDLDQHRTFKWTSVMRVMAQGHANAPRGIWPEGSRAEYSAVHGIHSIVSYFDLTRALHRPMSDGVLALHYERQLGYTMDRGGHSRRYGGIDTSSVVDDAGLLLAQARHHWLWFRADRGALLDEPAPGFTPDEQSTELPPVPVRPSALEESVTDHRFRWSSRETDLNQHVTFSAYVERAENALADEKTGTDGLPRLEAWFRQQSFLGDAMRTAVQSGDGCETVRLEHAESGALCAVLRWSTPSTPMPEAVRTPAAGS